MINFKIYLRSSSKAMANREKVWNMEKQNFKYLEKEKSFLYKIKNIFHSF